MKDITQETIAAPELAELAIADSSIEPSGECGTAADSFAGSAEYQSTKSDWLHSLERHAAKKKPS